MSGVEPSEARLDMAGDEIVDSLAAAAIGHLLHAMPAIFANQSTVISCCDPTPPVAKLKPG